MPINHLQNRRLNSTIYQRRHIQTIGVQFHFLKAILNFNEFDMHLMISCVHSNACK